MSAAGPDPGSLASDGPSADQGALMNAGALALAAWGAMPGNLAIAAQAAPAILAMGTPGVTAGTKASLVGLSGAVADTAAAIRVGQPNAQVLMDELHITAIEVRDRGQSADVTHAPALGAQDQASVDQVQADLNVQQTQEAARSQSADFWWNTALGGALDSAPFQWFARQAALIKAVAIGAGVLGVGAIGAGVYFAMRKDRP